MRSRPGSTYRRRHSRGAVRRPTMRWLYMFVGLALLAALLPPGAATAEAWTSIYSGSETVTGPGVDDPNPVELGVRFTVSTPGSVSAIRYYKTSGNTGVHVGSLWTSQGRRLAKVTFSSETATGWQVARLAEPIPLRPGRTYVASYHTNTGRYAAKVGVFANGATIGNSTIRATSGVCRYGSGGFPLTRESAAYFVDVFFTPKFSASIGSDPSPSQSATPSVPTTSTPTSTPTGTAAAPRRQLAHRRQWLAPRRPRRLRIQRLLHRNGSTQSAPYPVGRGAQLLEVITIASAVCQSRCRRMG